MRRGLRTYIASTDYSAASMDLRKRQYNCAMAERRRRKLMVRSSGGQGLFTVTSRLGVFVPGQKKSHPRQRIQYRNRTATYQPKSFKTKKRLAIVIISSSQSPAQQRLHVLLPRTRAFSLPFPRPFGSQSIQRARSGDLAVRGVRFRRRSAARGGERKRSRYRRVRATTWFGPSWSRRQRW
ncbi:hypothetical protein EI94DRAFT_1095820 [Lactarius quietus]|nr:hypothetical protein EI94DRAFT_1095820 [Lactarius quietus]